MSRRRAPWAIRIGALRCATSCPTSCRRSWCRPRSPSPAPSSPKRRFPSWGLASSRRRRCRSASWATACATRSTPGTSRPASGDLVRQRCIHLVEGRDARGGGGGALLDQELGHREEMHHLAVAQPFGFDDQCAHAMPHAEQSRRLLLGGKRPATTPAPPVRLDDDLDQFIPPTSASPLILHDPGGGVPHPRAFLRSKRPPAARRMRRPPL